MYFLLLGCVMALLTGLSSALMSWGFGLRNMCSIYHHRGNYKWKSVSIQDLIGFGKIPGLNHPLLPSPPTKVLVKLRWFNLTSWSVGQYISKRIK